MIYLIGGAPKCGKTTLAKKLSAASGIPWISADTLQNIVWAYASEEKRTELFPHKFARSNSSNDVFYSEHTPKEIIDLYIAQGKTTYDAISMMAETYLADEDNFIVEGYQVTPEVAHRVIEKFGKDHVKAVFLTKYNTEKFVQDIHKSTTPNDWIIRKTKDESTFQRIAEMIAEYSKYFEEEAGKYDLSVYNMDENFEEQLEAIQNHLYIQ